MEGDKKGNCKRREIEETDLENPEAEVISDSVVRDVRHGKSRGSDESIAAMDIPRDTSVEAHKVARPEGDSLFRTTTKDEFMRPGRRQR